MNEVSWAGGGAPAGPSGASMASTNAAIPLNRSAGALARARVSAAATGFGTSGWKSVIRGGATVRCRSSTLSVVGPVNGGCPASISYSTHASAY